MLTPDIKIADWRTEEQMGNHSMWDTSVHGVIRPGKREVWAGGLSFISEKVIYFC